MIPTHNSFLISKHAPAWFLCVWPKKNVILTSYEADFAGQWGHDGRLLYEEFGPFLANHKLDPDSSSRSRWDIVTMAGRKTNGGMRAVGMGGAITGKGADFLIIDDPVKNAEDADSPTLREKNWDWFESTAFSRIEPTGGMVLVQTRWNEDDLAGRLIHKLESGQFGNISYKIINLPALAFHKKPDKHGKMPPPDPLGRLPGEALWPWKWSKDRMEEIKHAVSPYWWNCLYQGRPVARGGKSFERKWFRIIDAKPKNIIATVRFWDLAATKDGGDYTVGLKMSKTAAGMYIIEHVIRGQWSSKESRLIIPQTCKMDHYKTMQRMEQEPAAGGKMAVDAYRTLLSDYDFDSVNPRVDKEISWIPFSDECAAGNVLVLKSTWTEEFLDEIEKVPNPRGYDDQVDAASGAYKILAEIQQSRRIVIV